MVLNVNKSETADIKNYFEESLDEIAKDVKKTISKDISKIMLKIGPREEKKIFRYIANRVMGHVNPPKTINDYPVFQGVSWDPLAVATVVKKGHKRQWIDSGSLRNYLRGLSATYWYGQPKVRISRDLSEITYYSIFGYSRKPFRAHDERGTSQEMKISGENGSRSPIDTLDNKRRPIFGPMEAFLFDLSGDLINEAINDYMEEKYGLRYNVPTEL